MVFFFVHHIFHFSPAFIALGAAGMALLWVQPEDMAKTLEHVEWPVLLFFSALFVLIGGLDAAGVLEGVATAIAEVSHINPILLGVIMIWVVAGLSAVVDNIPITIALIPVIQGMAASGINVHPLWWALVFGAGFGGNGTIIGSTANIVVVSLSEKNTHPHHRRYVGQTWPAGHAHRLHRFQHSLCCTLSPLQVNSRLLVIDQPLWPIPIYITSPPIRPFLSTR